MATTGCTTGEASHRSAFGEIGAASHTRVEVPIDGDDLAGIEAFLQSEIEGDDLLHVEGDDLLYVESVLLDSGVDDVGLIRTQSVTMIGERRPVARRLIEESFDPLRSSMDVLRRSDAVWRSRHGSVAASRQGYDQESGDDRPSQDIVRQGIPHSHLSPCQPLSPLRDTTLGSLSADCPVGEVC